MRKLVFSGLSLMTFLVPSASAAESLEGPFPIYVSCFHLVPDNQNLVSSIFKIGRGALVDGMFEHAGNHPTDRTTSISVHGTPGQGKDITAQWQELLLSSGVNPERVYRAGCAMGRSVEVFLEARRNQVRDHPSRRIDDARFNSWVPGPGVYGNYVAEVWDWGGRKLSDRPLGRSGSRDTSPRAKGTASTKLEDRHVSTVLKGPTPNQLKYQREMEAFNARLAEIERIKVDSAARHAANQAAAKQVIAGHEQDMAKNRAEVAAAQRRYQQELADHQRLVALNETKADRESKVEWKEAIVVCEKKSSDGQSRFGNWRCEGPLQMTYAKLDEKAPTGFADMGSPGPLALSQACGGKPESVRDLGIVGTARLFGCSYGLHPDSRNNATSRDQAARHGIGYVPGRATYHCPAYKSYCRTN